MRGFSLIEMLLSLAIITMLVGMSVPVYASFANANDLDLTRQHVVSAMRRAQTYARGVKADSQWGISVSSGQVVVFKGTSYAARDATYDETIPITTTITPSGLTEVVFTKLTGRPASTGTTILTSTGNNNSKTVVLNALGTVE